MQDSERKIYYDIVTKCWVAFSKGRPYPEFSGEWWDRLIADFDEIRKEYRGTDYSELVNELTMKLQDQHERRQREWKQQQKSATISDRQQIFWV